ncbi:MAG: pilus assembly protein PilP [Succinivibrionaceae bacterium]
MKVKFIPAVMLSVSAMLLTGCGVDSSLQEYVRNSLNQPTQPPEPLPEPVKFESMPFEPQTDRSPFSLPKPENIVVQHSNKKSSDCLQPDTTRPKDLLEQYSLDNLSMRGTFKDSSGKLWALINTGSSGSIEHQKVTVGNYIGLNYGKITAITPNAIEVEEYIGKGDGCFELKPTQLELSVSSSYDK